MVSVLFIVHLSFFNPLFLLTIWKNCLISFADSDGLLSHPPHHSARGRSWVFLRLAGDRCSPRVYQPRVGRHAAAEGKLLNTFNNLLVHRIYWPHQTMYATRTLIFVLGVARDYAHTAPAL